MVSKMQIPRYPRDEGIPGSPEKAESTVPQSVPSWFRISLDGKKHIYETQNRNQTQMGHCNNHIWTLSKSHLLGSKMDNEGHFL